MVCQTNFNVIDTGINFFSGKMFNQCSSEWQLSLAYYQLFINYNWTTQSVASRHRDKNRPWHLTSREKIIQISPVVTEQFTH